MSPASLTRGNSLSSDVSSLSVELILQDRMFSDPSETESTPKERFACAIQTMDRGGSAFETAQKLKEAASHERAVTLRDSDSNSTDSIYVGPLIAGAFSSKVGSTTVSSHIWSGHPNDVQRGHTIYSTTRVTTEHGRMDRDNKDAAFEQMCNQYGVWNRDGNPEQRRIAGGEQKRTRLSGDGFSQEGGPINRRGRE